MMKKAEKIKQLAYSMVQINDEIEFYKIYKSIMQSEDMKTKDEYQLFWELYQTYNDFFNSSINRITCRERQNKAISNFYSNYQ